ncbi:Predicted transcriptional regulator, ArsR family [Nakamurella panacisegetis]|uniref:Predicted transcriptional regulator, ArsR family n=1 Tax=Nakamurella panacisegetis TaxID=1090615 RepID=A0A1H0SG96_9ACTN|nr:helix-turn-helix domain-containing protein [Nakamurella panacisegetis]SDP40821.1 Predicted transcriptional regulator, ArsR family [Nakamurella panacisegetis]
MKTLADGATERSAPSAHRLEITAVEPNAEVRTRETVVRLLLARGPLTAVALAEQIGLSPAAIRRHLDQLLAEGAITSREASTTARRGRGRPARTYLLTDVGRTRLPHAYDSLAVEALEFLAESAGPDAVAAFARRRAENLVDAVRDELEAAPDVPAKAQILARALTESGFAASVEQVGIGEQLCQHHCPVAHVATRFPQLCEEEMAVITEALGTYAQRLATIANGDSFCTTFIPAAHSTGASAPHAVPRRNDQHISSAPQGRTTS